MTTTNQQFERFWAMVSKTDGCWIFTGPKHKDGYGRIRFYGRKWLAHRIAWTISIGKIPAGMFVLHRCDNPPCVNPKHLFIGTQADNMHDCRNKGRRKGKLVGDKVGTAKLNASDVLNIRLMSSAGMLRKDIAKKFHVTAECVSGIVLEKSWRHLL